LVQVSAEQRSDTAEGRAAERRTTAIAVAIGVIVVALVGLLCFGVVYAFQHPGPGDSTTDCGDCGWH
jgi:hypothetical protein